VSYRALKRQFALDDDYVEDLKAELIDAERVAADEDGKVLVWIGDRINAEDEKAKGEKGGKEDKSLGSSVQRLVSREQSPASSPQTLDTKSNHERLAQRRTR
jgi:hypothetical protein